MLEHPAPAIFWAPHEMTPLRPFPQVRQLLLSALIPAYQAATFLQQKPQASALPQLQQALHSWVQKQGLSAVLDYATLSFQGSTVVVEPSNHPDRDALLASNDLAPSREPGRGDPRTETLLAMSSRGLVLQGELLPRSRLCTVQTWGWQCEGHGGLC